MTTHRTEHTNSHPTLIITALSPCLRGEPLTTTRPYSLLPICNVLLINWQLDVLADYNVLILGRGKGAALKDYVHDHSTFINADDKAAVEHAVGEATLIIPGDLLFNNLHTVGTKALITTAIGSEEEAAAKALLAELGLNLPLEEITAQRINYPWELLDANQAAMKLVKKKIDSSVTTEENVTIKGEVAIGKNSIIRAGSYLEGPTIIGDNCDIGPMAHLRPETSIGDNCRIGKTEIVDCVLMRGCTSKHAAYLGHSVLGEGVNIGAFTVTADFRHDGKSHITLIHGEKIDTKRRKLGAFLGDNVHTAITTSIYPGRKLWPEMSTLPGEVVTKDKVS